MKRQLTQHEIDAVFQNTTETHQQQNEAATTAFDFSRLDRIPKSQLRAIHLLHEDFVRSLSSHLSAYLRAFANLSLVSLEQISYAEYLEGLASPTCLAYISLKPYEGTALMEVSQSLVFALVEVLLGGSIKEDAGPLQRKITDIEKGIMQNVLRIVLNELQEAWKTVADIRFAVQLLASEPQLLHVLAPREAVVVITIDVRIGAAAGVLSIAIPSIFIKRLRHRFDQLRQVRKIEPTDRDRAHMAKLIAGAEVNFEARLGKTRVSMDDFLGLDIGDILVLDQALDRPVSGVLNGEPIYSGQMLLQNEKIMFQVERISRGED